MRTRSRALVVIGVLLMVMVGSVAAIVFGARYAARRVPGHGLLALEISGPLPEYLPEDPLAGLFSSRAVTQQELRTSLVRAAADDRILAVRVRISDLSADFAAVQEIRDLLRRVGDAGKPTTAYLDTAGEFSSGNVEYYLATGCQRIVVSPMGDVNLVGLAARSPFVRGTLDKLGIEPEFLGIGEYKTARFFYTEKDFTPEHREMTGWLMTSLADQLARGIAEGRGWSDDQARKLIEGGPYLGPAAVQEGLIDELADWQACRDATLQGESGRLEEISLRRYLRSANRFSSGPRIAVIVAEGTIVRGSSGYSPVPLFGGDLMGSDTIARAFRQARDSGARAVVLRINSPGGSAVASEIIRAEMERTAEELPVVVSMGGVAASGGYWITCGANAVLADPGTITASIGVFVGHLAMQEFWNKTLGVTWGRIDGAPNADLFGALDPWTPEQRVVARTFLDRIYDAFLERVAAARSMSRDQVDAVGRGRVFTGEQALERGLVDELGGFLEALDKAKELAGIDSDSDVELVYYPRLPTVVERLMDREIAGVDARMERVKALVDGRLGVGGPVWLPPMDVR